MAACNEANKKVEEEWRKIWAACWVGWDCLRGCSKRLFNVVMPDSPRRSNA